MYQPRSGSGPVIPLMLCSFYGMNMNYHSHLKSQWIKTLSLSGLSPLNGKLRFFSRDVFVQGGDVKSTQKLRSIFVTALFDPVFLSIFQTGIDDPGATRLSWDMPLISGKSVTSLSSCSNSGSIDTGLLLVATCMRGRTPTEEQSAL